MGIIMNNEKLSFNMEDYLETILLLQKEYPVARAKDIAERLNVKKSSVTNALKLLSEKKLINYDKYSYITLTDKGKKYAEEIFKTHSILKEFLIKVLEVDDDSAEANACRMEHVIDKDIIQKISMFLDFILKSDSQCINLEQFQKEIKKD